MLNSEILPFLYNFLHTGQEDKAYKILKYVKTTFDLDKPIPFFGLKKWDGEDLVNKSLLIYSDQGMGDYIQFVRYVIELQDKYNNIDVDILLGKEQYNALHRLKTLGGNERLLKGLDCVKTYDYFINLVSVPYYLYEIDYNYPPFNNNHVPKIPYFDIKKDKKILDGDNKKIGLKWKTRLDGVNHKEKSKTQEEFESFAEFGGLYSLDNTITDSKIIKNLPIEDLYDVALYMKEMDLIISVDTATLHLAGAIGMKTFGLFNKDLFWRWQGIDRVYPNITPCFNIDEIKMEMLI